MGNRRRRFLALAFLSSGGLFGVSVAAFAASAAALVSATVLGPAETEISAGAVSISKVSDLEFGEVSAVGPARRPVARTLARYRLGGGFHASYRVSLPDAVTVHSGASRLEVSGFRTSGSAVRRLGSDGSGTFEIGASVVIPSGQAPGTYAGSYAVTVAYD